MIVDAGKKLPCDPFKLSAREATSPQAQESI